MKKILFAAILVLGLTLVGVAVPQETAEGQALGPMEECEMVRDFEYEMGDEEISYSSGDEVEISADEGAGAVACTINLIYRVANAVLWFAVALVVILVMVGGFYILTAGPNEEKVEKGKKYISYSVIGVVIAVFAYAAPWIINFVVG